MAFPTAWKRKCALSIQSSKVSADLTNFPVLISKDTLPSEMFDADGSYPAQNGGGDIRFTSDAEGTTRLSCEIVSFVTDNDPSNGHAEIYVKVPSVSSSSDTTIYVWYNTPTTESQPARDASYGIESVWDSNFQAVYHLNESPNTSSENYKDSTSKENHLTSPDDIPSQCDGIIGNALEFDGLNDQGVLIAPTSTFDITSNDQARTFEAWAYIPTSLASGWRTIVEYNRGEAGWTWLGDSTNGDYLNLRVGSVASHNVSSASISADVWQHCVLSLESRTSGNLYAWVNATKYTATTSASTNASPENNKEITIGANQSSSEHWNGCIDEVRLSNGQRSDSWITSTYNSVSSPSTFVTEGTPESTGYTTIKALFIPGIL